MMLQVMAYAAGIAALSSAVGLCLERLARLHGLPRRTVWMAAMLLSVLLPLALIAGSRPAPVPAIAQVAAPVTESSDPGIFPASTDLLESQLPAYAPVSGQEPVPATATASAKQESTWRIPTLSDRQLIALWLLISSAVGLFLCGAHIMLRRRAAGWHRAMLLEHDVLVSEVTGPALIGVLRPEIVVPRWLLEQPAAMQALILEHERQHLKTRDPLLIAAGLFILTAVPWNLPLWWQWRRLRQAVELDCDARVLRAGAEANTYAEVLLAVTRRATRMPAGALAMSEPVNVLERRIENLVPDALRYVRLQTVTLLALIAAAATAATALEAPRLPAEVIAGAAMNVPQNPEVLRIPASTSVAAAAAVTTPAASPAPAGNDARPVAQSQPVVAPSALAPAPFTVRLLPLDVTGSGVMDKALLERIHATLAARLRALRGLTLLTPESTGNQGPNYEVEIRPAVVRGVQWANFRVRTLSKAAPSIAEALASLTPVPRPVEVPAAGGSIENGDRGATFIANTVARLRGMDPSFSGRTLSTVDGRAVVTTANAADVVDLNIIPSNLLERMEVVTGFGERLDLPGEMEEFVARLQVQTFPEDPALKVNLLDPRVEFGVRQKTLELLLRIAPQIVDPAVLAGGIDLAAAATDPLRRAAIWKQLGRTRSAEIVGPLVQALGVERDDQVRLDMIGILSRNFSMDPRARAAFDSIIRNDRQPQIARMAAQRALTGDGGWNEFMASTLKNPQLTDTQRLAPLAYVEPEQYGTARPPALDEGAMRILGQLIARAETFSPGVRAAAVTLGLSSSPAAVDVIIDILRPRDSRSAAGSAARDTVLYFVGGRSPMDPRIRAAIEEVAARDSDPAVRGTSQVLLELAARRTPIGKTDSSSSSNYVDPRIRAAVALDAVIDDRATVNGLPNPTVGKPVCRIVRDGIPAVDSAGRPLGDPQVQELRALAANYQPLNVFGTSSGAPRRGAMNS